MMMKEPFKKTVLLILIALLWGLPIKLFALIHIIDDNNHAIILSKTANRLVTLSPDETEIIFAIGSGEKIVGTVNQSVYPKTTKKIQRIGNYTKPNLEKIISLSPDLIILPRHGIPYSFVEKLNSLGIAYYIFDPKNLNDIPNDMKKLGILTGVKNTAFKEAHIFNKKINKIKQIAKSHKKIKMFYELWGKPLMTIGKNTLVDEIITLCGGENIFHHINVQYPVINFTHVIMNNPEVIIVSNNNQFDKWKKWPILNAVKYNHIYYIKPELLQHASPRLLQGAMIISRYFQMAANEQSDR